MIQTQSVFSSTRLDGKQKRKTQEIWIVLIKHYWEMYTQIFKSKVSTLVTHEPIIIKR